MFCVTFQIPGMHSSKAAFVAITKQACRTELGRWSFLRMPAQVLVNETDQIQFYSVFADAQIEVFLLQLFHSFLSVSS